MSQSETWALASLAAFVVLSLLARHPALSRIAIVVAVGAIPWSFLASLPTAVWVCSALVAVGLAAGPARVVCFELEEDTERREPTWAKTACWLMTLAAVADGAWCAYLLAWPGRSLTGWEWFCAAFAALAAGLIVRFSLGPRIIDYVVSPLASTPSLCGETQVTDWFVARIGTGRATRAIHCVTLLGDPAVWRVSWWRLGTLATHADHAIAYRTATGAAGLRYVTQLRVEGPVASPAAVRAPAARRPIGPVVRTLALAGGALTVLVALALTALWAPSSGELGLMLLAGAVILIMVAVVVTVAIGLLAKRGQPSAERDGLRVVPMPRPPVPTNSSGPQ